VAPAGEGVFSLTLRTPAPLYLPAPLVFAPDRGDPVEVPWFTCGPRGCEARLTAGEPLVDALRAGQRASVELTLVDGAKVRLRPSLRGFTAALAAATRLGGAPRADNGPAPPVSP
jgi:invasion protein IalB